MASGSCSSSRRVLSFSFFHLRQGADLTAFPVSFQIPPRAETRAAQAETKALDAADIREEALERAEAEAAEVAENTAPEALV